MPSSKNNDDPQEVPGGAGVFPKIPAELNVHPLLLATLHATVFLSASDEKVVNPEAADEAFDYMAAYLRRLSGPERGRVEGDLATLAAYARQEKWTPEAIEFVETFLETCGGGPEEV
jgi:hypothetical protein